LHCDENLQIKSRERVLRNSNAAEPDSMKTKQLTAAVVTQLLILMTSSIRAADVVSVWGGARSTIILKSDGTVWTWERILMASSVSARRTTCDP
jgi:hypothetical protein